MVLHSGLQTIGERCFRGAGIASVDIPPTVKTIGEKAFARTFGLRDFRLTPSPDGLDLGTFVLQHSAVCNCNFGNRISELPYGTFWGCRGLRKLALPPGLQRLGAACFRDSDVERVEVPAGLEEIGNYAFQNCVCLREISFPPDSVLRRVGMGAFERSGLESFSTPKSLRVIGSGAFYRCDRLHTVKLNDGLMRLGDADSIALHGAFQDSAVERIDLPGSLRTLGQRTFEGCVRLSVV